MKMSSRNMCMSCLTAALLAFTTACSDGAESDTPPPFVLDEDCEFVFSSECEMVAMSPADAFAGAAVVASVHVDVVDPTIFNTAEGKPPDGPYDDELSPDDYMDATIEAVGRERHGPEWDDEGLAVLNPFDAGTAAYWYGVKHCEARAAALEAETGQVARCMRLSYMLPKSEPNGWRWNGGVEDGTLDLVRVREVIELAEERHR